MEAEPVRLDRVEFAAVDVTPRTTWTFARMWDADGAPAEAEITCAELTPRVAELVSEAVAHLRGSPIATEADVPRLLDWNERELRRDLGKATAVSALRTGASVLQAVKSGVSLTEVLGGEPSRSVQLYANINRGLFASQRTPVEFGAAAARAVAEGFDAVKCAPFDGVAPGTPTGDAIRLARSGIERVSAVRDAVGPEVALMVDCHSRFDVESAVAVASELGKLGVSWFEEPVNPATDPEGTASIAARVPMLVAGGEHGYGEEWYAGLAADAGVRVIMPDVKFCGGAAEAVRAGKAAAASDGGTSLHCPSGPVSLLTSAHVTAAIPGALRLEHAVYEAEWRAELMLPRENVADGRLHLTDGAGIGAGLDWDLLRRIGRVWSGD